MLEEQLMRSERLGATGRLAASVAHEINSPLQAVALLLGSLKRKAPRHPELLEDVDLLQASFELIKITVNQLLDLNRPGKNQRQPTDVNEVVEQTAGLLRSQVTRHKIEIDLRLDDGLPTVTASPTQLGQCLINLVNNAMEAILSQRNSEYPREAEAGAVGRIHIETGRAGDQVRIRLVDNGPGIPPDMLENVFDPFFTSKKKMGLGVGLSICHRIMEQHEGRIVAANAADSGAVFDLYLPGPPLAGDDWR
jgi:signal transduction histidine kinase